MPALYPKISIVTPNLNNGCYLEDTILSVLGQNYPNLEYIVIDGGSTDDSLELLKKYENQLFWISETDKSMYHAVQKGFEKSTGEIMAWINSDDMYHHNALFTIAEIFTSFQEVNWLVGASTTYDESGRTVFVAPSRQFTKFDFYNRDFKWLQQESVFWRRKLWDAAGSTFNLDLKYAGDFALWTKFFLYDRLYVTEALIGGFRLRSKNQISLEHSDDYLREIESVLNSLSLSQSEKNILAKYKVLLKLERIINIVKIFRVDWVVQLYRNKYFDEPKPINFDRNGMKFILSK